MSHPSPFGRPYRRYRKPFQLVALAILLNFAGSCADWFTAAHAQNQGAPAGQAVPAQTDQPPAGSFTVAFEDGRRADAFEAGTLVSVDASGSTDDRTAAADLEVRWDWESDDTFDTPFGKGKASKHVYFKTGTWTIKLEVRDGAGLVYSTTRTIEVRPGPAARFAVSGIAETIRAGTAGSLAVEALDAHGNRATGYTGTVVVSCTDLRAILPPDHSFSAGEGGDNGYHDFADAIAFKMAGRHAVEVRDAAKEAISGGLTGITVTAAAATTFQVDTEHGGTENADAPFRLLLTAKDDYGNTATDYEGIHTVHFTSDATAAPNGTAPTIPAGEDIVFEVGKARTSEASFRLVRASETPAITAGEAGGPSGNSAPIAVAPGAAASLVVSGHPDPVTAGTASGLRVEALDAFGNRATSYAGTVVLGSADDRATLPFTYGFTTGDGGDNGLHAFDDGITLRTSGEQVISARDAQHASISGTQSAITVTPAAAVSLVVSTEHGGVEAAGIPFRLQIKAQDAFGNKATGFAGSHTIFLASPSTPAPNGKKPSLLAAENVDFTTGTGWTTAIVLVNAAETPTITASERGGPSGTTAPITVKHREVSGLGVTTEHGGAESADAPFHLRLTAQDEFGNVVTTFHGVHSVRFTSTAMPSPAGTAPTAPEGEDVEFAAGTGRTAEAGFRMVHAGETPVITAQASDGPSGASEPIRVAHGAPASLVVAGYPNPVTAGATGGLSVEVLDAYGNRATSYSGTVAVTSADPQALLPAETTFTTGEGGDNGIHVFADAVALKTAGEQAIEVHDTMTAALAGSQASIVVTPAAPTTFRVATEHGGTEVAGEAFRLTLTAQDACGNTVPAYAGSHVVVFATTATTSTSGSKPVLPAKATIAFLAGIGQTTSASFRLFNGGETPTISASETGGPSGTSEPISVRPLAAASFAVGMEHGGAENADAAFHVVLGARDTYGNTATSYEGGHTIRFTSTAAASPSGTKPTVPETAVVEFAGGSGRTGDGSFRLVKAGQTNVTITATEAGGPKGTSATITVEHGTPASFAVTGHPDPASAGSPSRLIVEARDAQGNRATRYTSGVVVTSADPLAGLPDPYTFTTGPGGDNGQHIFPSEVTLRTAGRQTITVQDAEAASVTGSLSVNVKPAGAKVFVVTTEHGGVENADTPFHITLTALDEFGSTAAAYSGKHTVLFSITATASPGGIAPLVPARASVSFVSGVGRTAPGSFRLVNAAEQPTATASESGGPSGTSAPITVEHGKPASYVVATEHEDRLNADAAFRVLLAALDAQGNPATTYTGSHVLRFTSTATPSPSGTAPSIPDDVTVDFMSGEGRTAEPTFHLVNAGETPTVSAYESDGPTGTSEPLAVLPGAAAGLTFVAHPSSTTAGIVVSPAVQVMALDAQGNHATDFEGEVNLAIGTNPAGGTLSGTFVRTAGSGSCAFQDLSIDKVGSGYALAASAPGLAGATSRTFDITMLRIAAFATDKARVEFAGGADLRWALDGTAATLTLDPGGRDVTGSLSAQVQPFKDAAPGLDTRRHFKLRANTPAISGEIAEAVWAGSAGGPGYDEVSGVAAMADGGYLVTGYFQGTANFGSAGTRRVTLTASGGYDIFVARYDAGGGLVWARQAGGGDYDKGIGVTALADGALVVTGHFQGTAVFGAGDIEVTTLTSAGAGDLFVARYNAAGSLAWARRAGGAGGDTGYGAAALPDGGCVVTGYFQGTGDVDAGGGRATRLTSNGGSDVFLARYHPDGTLAWAKLAGGTGYDEGSGVAALADGSCIVTGYFQAGMVLSTAEPEAGILASAGNYDVFVARYGLDGTLAWARSAGGPEDDRGFGVATFADGSCAVTGIFQGDATFGPGEARKTVLASAGEDDVFLARFGPDGSLAWAQSAGSAGSDFGSGVATFPDGSAAVTGYFRGELILGRAGPESTVLVSGGGDDIFVARFEGDGTAIWAARAGGENDDRASGVAAWQDGSFAVAGFFQDKAAFDQGEGRTGTLASEGGFDGFLARYFPVNYRMIEVRPRGLAWAGLVGGEGHNGFHALVALPDGGCVATGHFESAVSFGGKNTEATELASVGSEDVIVARYKADGTMAWARRDGKSGSEFGSGVAGFADGSCVVTGHYQGSTGFGIGEVRATTLALAGTADGFLARYTPDGSLAWALRMGGTGDDRGRGVAAFSDGSCLVTGSFEGTAMFGQGEAEAKTLAADGNDDIFVARYGSDGKPIWAVRAGGAGSESGESVAALPDGGCAVTGSFKGTAVFGAGEANATTLVSAGEDDVFLARYNADGTLAWARRMGGKGHDYGNCVAAMPDGAFVVAGAFQGQAVFGAGEPRATTLASAGVLDGFLARFNPDGTLAWAVRAGGEGYDRADGLATLPDGGCMITGTFQGSAHLGSAGDTAGEISSEGGHDIFMARFGPDGALRWARRAGGHGEEGGAAMASWPDGSCAVAGYFYRGEATFGAGEYGATSLPASSDWDAFIVKIFPYED